MTSRETTLYEWNERLDTTNGEQIVNTLRHFHEFTFMLKDPLEHLETAARPMLEAIGTRCTDIAPLSLGDACAEHTPKIVTSLTDIVWAWSDLQGRQEELAEEGVELLDIANTAACMLEDRLVKPMFMQLGATFPRNAALPPGVADAAYEGCLITLTYIVILLAIGDGEAAETLGPIADFYLGGNIPLGIDERDTFLFLTR